MAEQEPSPPNGTSDKSTGLPRWKQLAWMIGGGIVLAIGGCGFFLSSIGDSGGIGGGLGAIAFVVGVLICLAGCVRWLFGAFRQKRPNGN